MLLVLQVLETILMDHLGNATSLQKRKLQHEDNMQTKCTETETQLYTLLGNW